MQNKVVKVETVAGSLLYAEGRADIRVIARPAAPGMREQVEFRCGGGGVAVWLERCTRCIAIPGHAAVRASSRGGEPVLEVIDCNGGMERIDYVIPVLDVDAVMPLDDLASRAAVLQARVSRVLH